jgi:hypothetical protein
MSASSHRPLTSGTLTPLTNDRVPDFTFTDSKWPHPCFWVSSDIIAYYYNVKCKKLKLNPFLPYSHTHYETQRRCCPSDSQRMRCCATPLKVISSAGNTKATSFYVCLCVCDCGGVSVCASVHVYNQDVFSTQEKKIQSNTHLHACTHTHTHTLKHTHTHSQTHTHIGHQTNNKAVQSVMFFITRLHVSPSTWLEVL